MERQHSWTSQRSHGKVHECKKQRFIFGFLSTMLWMLFTPSCSQALALDRTNIGVFKESLRIQLTISIPAQRKFELGGVNRE